VCVYQLILIKTYQKMKLFTKQVRKALVESFETNNLLVVMEVGPVVGVVY